MKPFHSLFPELAQMEVRCAVVGPYQGPEPEPAHSLPPGKYVFTEWFCEDPQCDCRQAFLQVFAESAPDKVLACLNVGWDDEAFYRKRFQGNYELAAALVRGELDPIHAQSKFAGELMALFQRFIKTTPYLLRLRRHYKVFREEIRRRQSAGKS